MKKLCIALLICIGFTKIYAQERYLKATFIRKFATPKCNIALDSGEVVKITEGFIVPTLNDLSKKGWHLCQYIYLPDQEIYIFKK